MRFFDLLAIVTALLRHRQRVSYRALKREFELDDACLADLRFELVEVEQVALDQDGEILVWAGEATNDAFAPLRAPRLTLARRQRDAGRRFARRRRPGAPQVQGRWSLTGPLFADAPEGGAAIAVGSLWAGELVSIRSPLGTVIQDRTRGSMARGPAGRCPTPWSGCSSGCPRRSSTSTSTARSAPRRRSTSPPRPGCNGIIAP